MQIPATSFPGSLTPQAIQHRESLGLSVKRFQSPGEGNCSVTLKQAHHTCSLLLYLVQELGVPYFLTVFRVIELRQNVINIVLVQHNVAEFKNMAELLK